MYLPAHISAGAIIGMQIKDPILAGGVAFASHFLLDAIPHWQLVKSPYRFSRRSVVTLVGTMVFTPLLGWYFLSTAPPEYQSSVLFAMVSSCIPDIDDILVMIPWIRSSDSFQRFRLLHNRLQHETTHVCGILSQVIPILLALLVE